MSKAQVDHYLLNSSWASHYIRNTELWFHTDKQKQERRSIQKQTGLKPDERNLLSTLPRQIWEEIEGNDTNEFINEGTEDLDYLPDLNVPTQLDKLLTNENLVTYFGWIERIWWWEVGECTSIQALSRYAERFRSFTWEVLCCRTCKSFGVLYTQNIL